MAPRTPRRSAVKRTPYKQRAPKEAPGSPPVPLEDSLPLAKESLASLVRQYKEKDALREAYISALRSENDYLRSLNASVLDYTNSLGLTIVRRGEDLHCTHIITKNDKDSSIAFTLSLSDGMYTYKYEESNIEDLPEYLRKEIYFEENQIKLFFFNVYECVARRS